VLTVFSHHGGFYSIFYEGARTLDHIANVGSDDNVHPYGTLSSVGKLLYGTNCNGWKAFEVCDTNSAHHGKCLGEIRTSEGGPGFRNTLDPELLQQWSQTALKKLNKEANYRLELFREEILQAKRQQEPVVAQEEEKQNSFVGVPTHLVTRNGTRVFPPQKRKRRLNADDEQDCKVPRIDDDGMVE